MGRSPVFLSSMMNLLVLVALLVQLVQPFSFNRAGLAGTLLSGHSPFRTDRLMRYEDEDYQASFDNPSFFPGSVEELAQDATFSVKVALISRINRMRIDVRSRLLSKERFAIRWVIHTALRLRDDEFRRIHVFIDAKYDPEKWQNVWREMAQAGYGVNKTTPAGAGSGSWKGGKGASATSASGSTSAIPTSTSEGWEPVPGWEAEYERVTISRITDEGITAQEEHAQDDLYLIYNPDNMCNIEGNVVEELQALCFHAALRNVPVVLINPMLIATAWNDYGARTPMLLRDFAQVYYICDDFFMLSRRDQWIGVVQRAASGFDMFFLEGLKPGQNSPDKFTRVMSWPDGAPDDIRSVVANFLLADPDFGNGVSIMEGRFGGVGSGGGGGGGVGVGVGGRGGDTRVGEGSRVAGGYINNRGFTTPEEVLRDEEGGRKNVGNSWRNIKPPPRRKTQKRE